MAWSKWQRQIWVRHSRFFEGLPAPWQVGLFLRWSFSIFFGYHHAVDSKKRQRLQSRFTVRQGTQAMARQQETANEGPPEG
jgi:hypothetical protein